MSYSITYQQKARKEYRESVVWYKERSVQAAENFEREVRRKIDILRDDPTRFSITYKSFREVKLSSYPFNIIYLIDEVNMVVIISSVYHHKRNPAKKYKS